MLAVIVWNRNRFSIGSKCAFFKISTKRKVLNRFIHLKKLKNDLIKVRNKVEPFAISLKKVGSKPFQFEFLQSIELLFTVPEVLIDVSRFT